MSQRKSYILFVIISISLRIVPSVRCSLTCSDIKLESCGTLDKYSPKWKDYLIISPLWSFKKSWVYCGHATTVTALRHTSLCDKLAVAFRSNVNGRRFKGFTCQYRVFRPNGN